GFRPGRRLSRADHDEHRHARRADAQEALALVHAHAPDLLHARDGGGGPRAGGLAPGPPSWLCSRGHLGLSPAQARPLLAWRKRGRPRGPASARPLPPDAHRRPRGFHDRLRGEAARMTTRLVVLAYNEEAGIGQSLAAIHGLGLPDLDVIVVDDGSTDRTESIVRQMKATVPLELLSHEVNHCVEHMVEHRVADRNRYEPKRGRTHQYRRTKSYRLAAAVQGDQRLLRPR